MSVKIIIAYMDDCRLHKRKATFKGLGDFALSWRNRK